MADTVTTDTIFAGAYRRATHITNKSDGTGETGVVKIDISAFTTSDGATATYSAIDFIEYSVWGFNDVLLAWDHTADDVIARLAGQGTMDWSVYGGNVDPQSAGGTGDVVLTTSGGAASTSGYDITIHWRPKA